MFKSKKYHVSMLLVFSFLFFSVVSAYGEDYQDKSFPTEQIIAKAYSYLQKGNIKYHKWIGKYLSQDNVYICYTGISYNNDKSHKVFSNTIELIRLDTNKWIFRSLGSTGVLQK